MTDERAPTAREREQILREEFRHDGNQEAADLRAMAADEAAAAEAQAQAREEMEERANEVLDAMEDETRIRGQSANDFMRGHLGDVAEADRGTNEDVVVRQGNGHMTFSDFVQQQQEINQTNDAPRVNRRPTIRPTIRLRERMALGSLDNEATYMVQNLNLHQIRLLREADVDYSIYSQPNLPENEIPPTEPVYSVFVDFANLAPFQACLDIIFTGFGAPSDVEGIVTLTWRRVEAGVDAPEDAPEDAPADAPGWQRVEAGPPQHEAEPDAPEPEPEPPPPHEPLRVVHVADTSRSPAEAHLLDDWRHMLRYADYQQLLKASVLLPELSNMDHLPIQVPLIYTATSWEDEFLDMLEVPEEWAFVLERLNDQGIREHEIKRLVDIIVLTGCFGASSGQDPNGDVNRLGYVSPFRPVPFFYGKFITAIYQDEDFTANMVRDFVGNLFINRLAQFSGHRDQIMAPEFINGLIRHLSPEYMTNDAAMNELLLTVRAGHPPLESPAVPSAPESIPPTVGSMARTNIGQMREPISREEAYEGRISDQGELPETFRQGFNDLLLSAPAQKVEEYYEIFGPYARRIGILADYEWDGEWLSHRDIPESLEELENDLSVIIGDYDPDDASFMATQTGDRCVMMSLIDEGDVDSELDDLGSRHDLAIDTTNAAMMGFFIHPVVDKIFNGSDFEAAQLGVAMLNNPLVGYLSEALEDAFVTGDLNDVLRHQRLLNSVYYKVNVENQVFRIEHNNHDVDPIWVYRGQPLTSAPTDPVEALHDMPSRPTFKPGQLHFSILKHSASSIVRDESNDYIIEAKRIAAERNLNLFIISRDGAMVSPWLPSSKPYKAANGKEYNFDPNFFRKVEPRGMVWPNGIYIHVHARPSLSNMTNRYSGLPDALSFSEEMLMDGSFQNLPLAEQNDPIRQVKAIRWEFQSTQRAFEHPRLIADFEMLPHTGQTFNGATEGEFTVAQFANPHNVYINYQMLRRDTEANQILFAIIMKWIMDMVEFTPEFDEAGDIVDGTLGYSGKGLQNAQIIEKLLFDRRMQSYIRRFKKKILGDVESVSNTIEMMSGQIELYTSKIIEAERERRDNETRLVALREKGEDFGRRMETEIQGIVNMEGIKRVSFPDGGGIMAETEYLLIYDDRTADWYELGECTITLLNDGKVRVHNQTRKVKGLKERMNHPHIYPEGNICLGDLSKTLPNYYTEAAISALVDIILQVCVNVNSADTAGAYVSNWPKCDEKMQKFLDENFKSRFQAGRVGYAAYKEYLAKKEKENVPQPATKFGSETAGAGGFLSDAELELAAGDYIDEAGNIHRAGDGADGDGADPRPAEPESGGDDAQQPLRYSVRPTVRAVGNDSLGGTSGNTYYYSSGS